LLCGKRFQNGFTLGSAGWNRKRNRYLRDPKQVRRAPAVRRPEARYWYGYASPVKPLCPPALHPPVFEVPHLLHLSPTPQVIEVPVPMPSRPQVMCDTRPQAALAKGAADVEIDAGGDIEDAERTDAEAACAPDIHDDSNRYLARWE
jgi:hypothetical protein